MVRLEALSQWKILKAASGIKSGTFQLVAQCLNQIRCLVPSYLMSTGVISREQSGQGVKFTI
jgi:hypothetical protein